METRQSGNWTRRGIAAAVAAAIALLAFSGTSDPTPPAKAAAQPIAPAPEPRASGDPSLAGLSVAADAEPGGDVEMYY